jgi:predicted deacylase
VTQSSLCTTLGGRDVPLLTITAPPDDCESPWGGEGQADEGGGGKGARGGRGKDEMKLQSQFKNRRVVFISSRVHPGETPASWIMHGVLDFLTSPHEAVAARLRREIVFKVVPMFNPDGVALGNYRTSLAGQDLNRCWAHPDKIRHPEIYYAKQLLGKLPTPATLFLDLHAHSRLPDCFLYGCGGRAPLSTAAAAAATAAAAGTLARVHI